MIRVAFGLMPRLWLDEDGIDFEPLRLEELQGLDEAHTRALLQALAIEAGHPRIAEALAVAPTRV